MSNDEMELLYNKYKNSVYRLAFSYCKNTADAEDITQETFIKRFTADIKFSDDKSEKAWLMKVAANKCKDLFKSITYKYFYYSISLEEANLTYESSEESAVYHAVMELPPKYRIVIHLYYYEDYSVAEIGKILGKSDTAIQTRLYRARNLLKKSLGEGMEL